MCSVLLVGELTAEDFAVNWQTTSARKYAVVSVGKEMEQSFSLESFQMLLNGTLYWSCFVN